MKKNLAITDVCGFLMKFLICAIIWYQAAIHPFIQINNMLLLLGLLLTGVVFIDCIASLTIPSIPKACYIIFMYVILTFITGILVSPDLSAHISGGITYVEFALIMFYVCYCIKRTDSSDFLVWNYLLLYLFMGAVFLISPQVYNEHAEGIRYSYSANTNPNSLAMGLSVCVWTILYKISQHKIKFFIGIPICGVLAYASIQTGSKKGLVAMVICIVLWFLLCYIPHSPKKDILGKVARFIIVAVSVLLLLYFLVPYFQQSTLLNRFMLFENDASTKQRYDMYIKGLEYLKRSPLLGYSFSGFAHFYGLYSHSTWVEVFVSSGIPIALLYFSSYVSIAINLWRKRKTNLDGTHKYMEIINNRQHIILFVMMLFYTICIIHVYDLSSYICFAMIIMSYRKREEITK